MKKTLRLGLSVLAIAMSTSVLSAQEIPYQAFQSVKIHFANGKVSDSSNLVWKGQLLLDIGKKADLKKAYTTDGGDSLHIYPAFIDGLSDYASPKSFEGEKVSDPGNPTLERAGIQSDRIYTSSIEEKALKDYKTAVESGFGIFHAGLKGYMMPGQTDVVLWQGDNTPFVLKAENAQIAQLAEAPGGWGRGVYPSTLMGVIARFRQLWYDASALKEHVDGYEAGAIKEAPVLEQKYIQLFPYLSGEKPLYFVCDSKENIERIFKLQDELGFDFVLVSAKDAWKLKDELKSRKIDVLASFDFELSDEKKDKEKEETKEVSAEEKAFNERVEESKKEQLMNIKTLMDAGVKVGYSSYATDKLKFDKALKALLDNGLSEKDLLKLLTTNTADILGIDTSVGDLTEGKVANFFVTDKPITEKDYKVLYTVSNGNLYNHLND